MRTHVRIMNYDILPDGGNKDRWAKVGYDFGEWVVVPISTSGYAHKMLVCGSKREADRAARAWVRFGKWEARTNV